MKEFGETAYKNVIYIDFYNNKQAQKLFDDDLKPRRILEELSFISGESIYPWKSKLAILSDCSCCS